MAIHCRAVKNSLSGTKTVTKMYIVRTQKCTYISDFKFFYLRCSKIILTSAWLALTLPRDTIRYIYTLNSIKQSMSLKVVPPSSLYSSRAVLYLPTRYITALSRAINVYLIFMHQRDI
jgi:hypothetical protein